jgi:hypothetical protein
LGRIDEIPFLILQRKASKKLYRAPPGQNEPWTSQRRQKNTLTKVVPYQGEACPTKRLSLQWPGHRAIAEPKVGKPAQILKVYIIVSIQVTGQAASGIKP